MGIAAFFHSEVGNIPTLLQHLADIIDKWRTVLPAGVVQFLPEDIDDLRETLAPCSMPVQRWHAHSRTSSLA